MTLREHLTPTRLRVVLLLLVVLSGAYLLYASQTSVTTATEADVPTAPERDGHTVVTESGRAGTIIAWAPDGDVQYYNNSRTKYFDVDPVEGEDLVVEYAASDTIHSKGPNCDDPPCARNVIERANLTSGEVEVIYERYDYKETAGEWHDHVRLDDERILIADIVADQVFIVNTETEIVEWLWDAQSEFPVEEGGPYPSDWAHINDVSLIEEGEMEGHVMVSLRNQDQVVFIDPETGMDHEWTLGAEDDYDVMYEQHNPDYIPESHGGPAVVLADSENARVEEFQRADGEWERSWEWTDDRMQWPRDADRLPNGNTLIADSHGKRVMEVTPEGEIDWQVPVTLPYEVERLETGDESTGGQSAEELGLESERSRSGGGGGEVGIFGALYGITGWLLPHRWFNGILYVLPAWVGPPEYDAILVGGLSALTWAGLELRWRIDSLGVRLRSPFVREGDDE